MTKTTDKSAMKLTRTFFADSYKYDVPYKATTIRYIKTRGRKTARHALNRLTKKAIED